MLFTISGVQHSSSACTGTTEGAARPVDRLAFNEHLAETARRAAESNDTEYTLERAVALPDVGGQEDPEPADVTHVTAVLPAS